MKKIITNALTKFAKSPHKQPGIIINEPRFQMHVIQQSGINCQKYFLIGSSIDDNSGGQFLQLFKDNINICIQEKTAKRDNAIIRKTACGKPPYQSWWLILVDQISFGPKIIEKEMKREKVKFNHDWAKIIVLAPNDLKDWIEI